MHTILSQFMIFISLVGKTLAIQYIINVYLSAEFH